MKVRCFKNCLHVIRQSEVSSKHVSSSRIDMSNHDQVYWQGCMPYCTRACSVSTYRPLFHPPKPSAHKHASKTRIFWGIPNTNKMCPFYKSSNHPSSYLAIAQYIKLINTIHNYILINTLAVRRCSASCQSTLFWQRVLRSHWRCLSDNDLCQPDVVSCDTLAQNASSFLHNSLQSIPLDWSFVFLGLNISTLDRVQASHLTGLPIVASLCRTYRL